MFGMPDVLINSPAVLILTFDCSKCRSLRDKCALGLNALVEVAMLVCFVLTFDLLRKIESDWLSCEQKMDRAESIVASPLLPAHLDKYLIYMESVPIFPYSIFSFPPTQ